MTIINDATGLNDRFDALLNEARNNEATLRRFQSFELALMATDSATELLEKLIYGYHRSFSWDLVELTLIDPEYNIRRILEKSEFNFDNYLELNFIEDSVPFNGIFDESFQPVMASYSNDTHAFVFLSAKKVPASICLLPLVRNHNLIGSFNVGSYDVNRFNTNSATDFLEHLAAVIAVCLETSISKEQLKHLGLFDNLTGVNNRRFFDQRLQEEVDRVKRTGTPLSCLFIDADHFKRINDNFGHLVGDEVLRYIAQIIRKQVRSIDIVARYGGEEFIVILLQTETERAEEIAERIRLEISDKPFQGTNEHLINITASIGINTLLPEQCSNDLETVTEQFINCADKALYIAKENGRNQVVNYRASAHATDKKTARLFK